VEFRPQPAEPFAIPDVLPFVGWHVEDHGDRHVVAGSIISPGQSGFINPAGQQDPHYEDQHELYAGWEYKPMPLAEDDVRALGGDRVESLSYSSRWPRSSGPLAPTGSAPPSPRPSTRSTRPTPW
jgi:hypothetical protein